MPGLTREDIDWQAIKRWLDMVGERPTPACRSFSLVVVVSRLLPSAHPGREWPEALALVEAGRVVIAGEYVER